MPTRCLTLWFAALSMTMVLPAVAQDDECVLETRWRRYAEDALLKCRQAASPPACEAEQNAENESRRVESNCLARVSQAPRRVQQAAPTPVRKPDAKPSVAPKSRSTPAESGRSYRDGYRDGYRDRDMEIDRDWSRDRDRGEREEMRAPIRVPSPR